MSPTADRIEAINVAPGDGLLVRQPAALLYVAGAPTDAGALVDAFAAADDGDEADAVTDAAVASGFEVPPFVLLTWNGPIRLVVQGALEVRTDDPTLPMLSGASSASWVERAIRPGDRTVTVECGATADPTTDLRLGRVLGAGFAVHFRPLAATPEDSPPAPSTGEGLPADTPVTAPPAGSSTPDRRDETPTTPTPAEGTPAQGAPATAPPSSVPAASPDPTQALDRMAALRAALGSPDPAPPSADPAPPADSAAPADPAPQDAQELPGSKKPLPAPTATGDDAGGPAGVEVDDEVTIAPGDSSADEGDHAPFVSAIRCPRDHLNPPHVGACRTCGELVSPGAPAEVVAQPPLGLLQLDDGETLPIDRSIVLGRKPDRDAAQADGRARLVAVSDDASVSRTHLRIDVEDWTLTVTDCGSRSGTAIVARPGEEPKVLDPWVPHELPVDARLFLGGPTAVVVRALPGVGRR